MIENNENEKVSVLKVCLDVVWTSEQLEAYLDEVEEVQKQTALLN